MAYIQSKFGIRYIVTGMNKWLDHYGFSYKKPKGVLHNFNLDMQQAFIKYYSETLRNI